MEEEVIVDNIPPQEPAAPAAPSRWEGLAVRAASAAVLALLFLAILWKGGWIFTVLVIFAALIMIREWNGLTEDQTSMWRFSGLFYVAIPCASLIWLRDLHMGDDPQAGLHLVLFVMFTVWATDIGAYITGRQVGGPKLAPAISPSKTWAGLGGGIGAAAVAGGLCYLFSPFPTTPIGAIILGAFIAAVSQAGDLFESWVKRRAGVKDSGTLIPGHGGLLDRVDGLILPLPLFAWLVEMSGKVL